jgi:death-on-curing protein
MSTPEPGWRWIQAQVVLAIHEMQLAEHGGGIGIRDAGLLDSALSRPRNLVLYGTPDAAELAASYAFGLARNHPFVDGNKRTAYVAAELFLGLNGFVLTSSDSDSILKMLALAAGDIDETTFAAWLRQHLAPRQA